jgi:hypothetical protein
MTTSVADTSNGIVAATVAPEGSILDLNPEVIT